MIALVAVTERGRAQADRLAVAWPGRTVRYPGTAREQLAAAWPTAEAIVCFLATGATVRLIAPLLAGKHEDPGVVCVDEAGRFAVALTGGHGGGANDLAGRVGEVLAATPVVTTATDAVGIVALDGFGADLGFRLADPTPIAAATAAILNGAGVVISAEHTWPLPAMPSGSNTVTVTISDLHDPAGTTVGLLYRPPSLVVGVGASRGAAADELDALITSVLADAGLAADSVCRLATVDVKAAEPGIIEVAKRRNWPLLTYPAGTLSTVDVPNPSEVVRAAVGTPSVAEAAALLGAADLGRAATLVAPKRASRMGTAAVARLTPRGRLTLVGLGPGAEDLRTPRAGAALRRASIVVGLDQYVAQIRHLLTPGTRVLASGLGAEEERARTAVELATAGHAVALIGSGDAGIYAMASPALQLAGPDVDVETVPGITAAVAAAARLGAPLGHDHAYVSLSDLHTPWEVIARRLHATAVADLVVCLYNPRSHKRVHQFGRAVAILAEHRPPDTPVGVVRDATRPDERLAITTLRELDPTTVDMRSVVIVGSSRTHLIAGRMLTPREYQWLA